MRFVFLLVLLIGSAVCLGSCSQYTDKESCMASCACCWTHDHGSFSSYQCQWLCAYDPDNQYNPTAFCFAVNVSVPFVFGGVIILAAAFVLLLVVGVLTVACAGAHMVWICVRPSVFNWLTTWWGRHVAEAGKTFLYLLLITLVVSFCVALAKMLFTIVGVFF